MFVWYDGSIASHFIAFFKFSQEITDGDVACFLYFLKDSRGYIFV